MENWNNLCQSRIVVLGIVVSSRSGLARELDLGSLVPRPPDGSLWNCVAAALVGEHRLVFNWCKPVWVQVLINHLTLGNFSLAVYRLYVELSSDWSGLRAWTWFWTEIIRFGPEFWSIKQLELKTEICFIVSLAVYRLYVELSGYCPCWRAWACFELMQTGLGPSFDQSNNWNWHLFHGSQRFIGFMWNCLPANLVWELLASLFTVPDWMMYIYHWPYMVPKQR